MIIIPFVALFNMFAVTIHCECVSLQIKSLPLSFNAVEETELLLYPFSSQLKLSEIILTGHKIPQKSIHV